MRRPARHTGKRRQHGIALMVMLVIMILGVAAALIGSLTATALKNEQQRKTAEALAQAKDALIGDALTFGDDPSNTGSYGYLPCPNTNPSTEGRVNTPCGSVGENSIGKLPWRTLRLPPLFDGSNECLWYAVSGNFKNNPKIAPLTPDAVGQLHVYNSDGNEITPGEIIALVISPGAQTNSNTDRSESSAPVCGGNYTATSYLENDTPHNINNTNITTGNFILPHNHYDANDNITLTVNDQFIYITRQDIFRPLVRRLFNELSPWASSPLASASSVAVAGTNGTDNLNCTVFEGNQKTFCETWRGFLQLTENPPDCPRLLKFTGSLGAPMEKCLP